ncbi:hypothetical protein V8E51_007465 [Hyaloscypha variabilis]
MYLQPCEQLRPLRNASIWHFIERSSQRRQAQSEKLLFDFLLDCVGDVPEDMVGTLGGEKQDIIRLPLVDPATGLMKGVLSWIKLARDVAVNVSKQNAPIPSHKKWHDCWLYPVDETESSGYPTRNVSLDGFRNKVGLHEILYHLVKGQVPRGQKLVVRCNRAQLIAAAKKLHSNAQDSALESNCGQNIYNGEVLRGRAALELGVRSACINPQHYGTMPIDDEDERDACNLGMRISCTHKPHCIWTGPEGQRRRCWDEKTIAACPHRVIICKCKNQCFTCWQSPPEVRTKMQVELVDLEEFLGFDDLLPVD